MPFATNSCLLNLWPSPPQPPHYPFHLLCHSPPPPSMQENVGITTVQPRNSPRLTSLNSSAGYDGINRRTQAHRVSSTGCAGYDGDGPYHRHAPRRPTYEASRLHIHAHLTTMHACLLRHLRPLSIVYLIDLPRFVPVIPPPPSPAQSPLSPRSPPTLSALITNIFFRRRLPNLHTNFNRGCRALKGERKWGDGSRFSSSNYYIQHVLELPLNA